MYFFVCLSQFPLRVLWHGIVEGDACSQLCLITLTIIRFPAISSSTKAIATLSLVRHDSHANLHRSLKILPCPQRQTFFSFLPLSGSESFSFWTLLAVAARFAPRGFFLYYSFCCSSSAVVRVVFCLELSLVRTTFFFLNLLLRPGSLSTHVTLSFS